MILFEKKTIVHNEIDYDKLAKAISKATNFEIDYDKLADSIVKASKADEVKAEKQRNQTLRKFRKKYKIIRNTSGRSICVKIANTIRIFHGFLNYNKEQSEEPVMTFELIRLFSTLFFFILEIIFIALGGLIIYHASTYESIILRFLVGVIGLFTVIFSNFFRIAKIEINEMDNKEMINTVFSSIMAFLGVVFAAIAILQGGGCNCVR